MKCCSSFKKNFFHCRIQPYWTEPECHTSMRSQLLFPPTWPATVDRCPNRVNTLCPTSTSDLRAAHVSLNIAMGRERLHQVKPAAVFIIFLCDLWPTGRVSCLWKQQTFVLITSTREKGWKNMRINVWPVHYHYIRLKTVEVQTLVCQLYLAVWRLARAGSDLMFGCLNCGAAFKRRSTNATNSQKQQWLFLQTGPLKMNVVGSAVKWLNFWSAGRLKGWFTPPDGYWS